MLGVEVSSSPLGMAWVLGVLALIPILYYGSALVKLKRNATKIGQVVDKFPGPDKHWLFGNLHQHPGANDASFQWGLKMMCEYKTKAFRIWHGPLRPIVVVYHPDSVKKVLRSTQPKQLSGKGGYSFLRSWLGDGLLLSSGSKWFRNRRLLTPAFHFDVLKPYMKVYNEAADILLEKFAVGAKSGSVEIFQPVSLCTLNVILRCAFSSDIDVQRKPNAYVNAVLSMAKLILLRAFNIVMYVDGLYHLSKNGKQYEQCLDLVHRTSKDVIARRKIALRDNPEEGKKRYRDFLDILLLARDENDEGMTDQEIQDEVDTFLFEGHDTTASAISWILYEMARNPDHQKKCQEEVDAFLSNRTGAEMQWDDLSKLVHTTMCIKEAIRVHCPVPLVGRETKEEFELEGVTLLPGTMIDVSIHLLHHNPEVWGDDHMEFKPERFHPDEVERMDSFAFVPFSAGPRNCIGQNFAMHEIKVVVSKVIHRFNIRLDENHEITHLPELVMRAGNGIKILFTSRE